MTMTMTINLMMRPARSVLASTLARRVPVPPLIRTKATLAAAKDNQTQQQQQDHPAFTHALQVLAQANALPPHTQLDTLRAFRNGHADFARPEFRSLGLSHFVNHRRPRLIQFAEQRHVFSDFFPKHEDQINVEVHVAARALDQEQGLVRIELGKEVLPTQMMEPLQVYLQPFHDDVKKYTFVLVDGDMARPDWEVRSEQVLWMVKDIPLSASTAPAPLPLPTTAATDAASSSVGTLVLPYVPPHPTQGTGAHRILAFVFEQPAEPTTAIPATLPRGISLWELIQAHGLTPRGIHVWKAQWDPSVSRVFKDVLNVKEPVFVTRPKIGRKGVDGLIENRYEGI